MKLLAAIWWRALEAKVGKAKAESAQKILTEVQNNRK